MAQIAKTRRCADLFQYVVIVVGMDGNWASGYGVNLSARRKVELLVAVISEQAQLSVKIIITPKRHLIGETPADL